MKGSQYTGWTYILDQEYAASPDHFIRGYQMIQSDLQKLFEYVEPSPEGLQTYSYRIHELLMRTCIEVEANFKAILAANIFTPKTIYDYKITNYKKINKSHHLSSFELTLPIWNGPRRVWRPFADWETEDSLGWYRAYNRSKHDRYSDFKLANLENLISAVAGLLVVLASQYHDQDFSPGQVLVARSGQHDYHEMEDALGGFFRIKYPDDWSDNELYDFDWNLLKDQPDRFQKYDYDKV